MKIALLSLTILFSTLPLTSFAKEPSPFYFFIQGIYSSTVTVNYANVLFSELEDTLEQPVIFKTGPTIDKVENAIDDNKVDVLFWGYSDKLNDFMQDKGYKHILSSYIPMYLYQLDTNIKAMTNSPKIGVLVDSTALYSAKRFYENQKIQPEFVEYDNYFIMMEASFRKDVDYIIVSKTFIIPQPKPIQKKFIEIQAMPSQARASFWIKSSLPKSVKSAFVDYIGKKQSALEGTFGTKTFSKPKD